MQLCDLCDDVLQYILEWFLEIGNSAKGFRDNLRLVAINRRLRTLALPLVYRDVFVVCARDRTVDESGPSVWTSADLAASVGTVGLARRIYIYVVHDSDNVLGVELAVEQLRAIAAQWPAVSVLSLAMEVVRQESDEESSDYEDQFTPIEPRQADDRLVRAAELELGLKGHARSLQYLLPNVRSLLVHGSTTSQLGEQFVANVAELYQAQLAVLRPCLAPGMPPGTCFVQLRDACLESSSLTWQRPLQLDSANLVRLQLANLELADLEQLAGANSDTQLLEFPALVSLHIRDGVSHVNRGVFGEGADPDSHSTPPVMLRFPRLREILVDSQYYRCPALECAVLPATLDSLEIHAPVAVYRSIANVRLPITKYLRLSVGRGSQECYGAMAAINRILANAQHSRVALLRVCHRSPIILPQHITCAGLTGLWLLGALSLPSVLELVKKLPRLTCLSVKCRPPSGSDGEILIPASDGANAIEPLDTRISRLSVGYSGLGVLFEQQMALRQHFMLKMPSLRELGVLQMYMAHLTGFVKAYAQQYPHLTKVLLIGPRGESRWGSWRN